MSNNQRPQENYSEYFALETEGGRVGLMSCMRCGALVLIGDAAFDAAKAHDRWHGPATTPTVTPEHRAESVPGGLQFPRCVRCGVLWPCPGAPEGSV